MESPSGHDPARAPAPADHDVAPQPSGQPPAGTEGSPSPRLVGDSADAVAFLDAPGLGAEELLDAVDGVLRGMSDGAILTVFTDDPTAPRLAAHWSAIGRVDVVAVIPHRERTGTTLTFRRATPRPGSDATGRPGSER
jgi:hypothetical protein